MTDKGDQRPGTPMPDFEALSRNMAQFVEEAGRVAAAYLKPYEEGRAKGGAADEVGDIVKTLGNVAEKWMSDPQKAIEAQSALTSRFLDLWASTLKRMQGEQAEPVITPDPKDKRFADPEWEENPLFDFIKQAYLLTTDWADRLAAEAEGLDDHTRHKAQFYVRQIASALAPSNFIATNPELIRTTLRESGANLVRGMQMLAEDVEAGGGQLKVRQSDPHRFEVGINLANTPGKVIFRNELVELIQYSPTTEKVLRRPLLIVPPWINKYYILDLNPDKSFIRWAVAQGLTVFCISWVNPDERLAEKSFEDYMREGIFAALDAIARNTGEEEVSAVGYCVGGTLLAATLAFMAANGDTRIAGATFLTTQVDFTHAGDLKVFVDEDQIRAIEQEMAKRGYLEGSRMATAFNMLRPNDLIWPYIVNNYVRGVSPLPFDLLYWNSDSTRMPAANHSFYMRECYLKNNLAKGRMNFGNTRLELSDVTIPTYHLATREDHIAPARSVFLGAQLFGGRIRFVLAGSGHIAGVVNPPAKPKYQHWVNGKPRGELDDWLKEAQEVPGSWWPDWIDWIAAQSPERVKARDPAEGPLAPLCDAPGTYVKMRD
ncbi:class I poly(R)-hydroxyalkanoic acid synthase [Chelatococcus daeguensis]|uniref:Poly(R)-hydroxyalkanoic acid synthase, class I n=1 Tax=Chelatococcus sambhunathii TaxID=363953 RepID=A0ABM9U195_9HYPH|nr:MULTISPECIES: class I poly(R)-hydroxyalkanoic acid synthase [Chelatococcus]KZE36780.1 poly(3-hydroxyalkanoate) synthetase [Chelatococcus daeguensis]MBM3082416.1 class I poly(R)-hydroxyalkanoic acid synthase [Chelatococcus daeguensis]CUA85377.1 poly(R)-hydroxyalkanoic acid synthase, class I [Chelatococcus sambhunathii]